MNAFDVKDTNIIIVKISFEPIGILIVLFSCFTFRVVKRFQDSGNHRHACFRNGFIDVQKWECFIQLIVAFLESCEHPWKYQKVRNTLFHQSVWKVLCDKWFQDLKQTNRNVLCVPNIKKIKTLSWRALQKLFFMCSFEPCLVYFEQNKNLCDVEHRTWAALEW